MILCDLTSWLDSISECIIALITIFSFFFAVSVFKKHYKVLGNYDEDYDYPMKDKFIITFVNKSRISTSVTFLGVFLYKRNIKRMSNGRIASVEGFPYDTKGDYSNYINKLTNIHSHNALTLTIPISDLITFINKNPYWNKHILSDITNKQSIKLIFAFSDYDDVERDRTLTVTPGKRLYKTLTNKINKIK